MSRQRKLLYQPILEKLACADINQTPASLRKTESRGADTLYRLAVDGLVRFDHVANDQHIAGGGCDDVAESGPDLLLGKRAQIVGLEVAAAVGSQDLIFGREYLFDLTGIAREKGIGPRVQRRERLSFASRRRSASPASHRGERRHTKTKPTVTSRLLTIVSLIIVSLPHQLLNPRIKSNLEATAAQGL